MNLFNTLSTSLAPNERVGRMIEAKVEEAEVRELTNDIQEAADYLASDDARSMLNDYRDVLTRIKDQIVPLAECTAEVVEEAQENAKQELETQDHINAVMQRI